jgi:hypothetical protein
MKQVPMRRVLVSAGVLLSSVGFAAAATGAKLPDLRITTVSNPPHLTRPGGRFKAAHVTKNAGAARAGASTTRYYLSRDRRRNRGDIRLQGSRVRALKRGQSAKGTATVTVPRTTPPTIYFLLACADDGRKVRESKEANNCRASRGSTRVARPSALSMSPTSHDYGSVVSGSSSAPSTFTVTNTGGSASAALGTSLGGSDPGQFQLGASTCTGTLTPGHSCTVAASFSPTSTGPKSATLAVNGAHTALSGTGKSPPPVDPALYVSALSGSDANPGTAAAPVRTIGKGLTLAASRPKPVDVRVGEGTYPEKVALLEGANLLGGFDCSPLPCSSTRDPATNHSTIVDQDFEGVLAPSTVTRATSLDGFTVTGKAGTPSGTYAAALTVAAGSPTLTHNTVSIDLITGSNKDSYGIAVLEPGTAPGPLIGSSTITALAATGRATGIGLLGSGTAPATAPVAVISGNVISGGSGASAAGIVANAARSGTSVTGNDIRAGTAMGSASAAWGIFAAGGTMLVDSNRINTAVSPGSCVTTTLWCGGIFSASAALDLTNNVVFGIPAPRSTALLAAEVETAALALRVNANYLDGGGPASSLGGSTSAAVTLQKTGTCAVCGANSILGKLRNNVLSGGVNESRFGIYEDAPVAKTARPEALQNNDFVFATGGSHTDALYRHWTGTVATTYTTIAAMELAVTAASGNFLADCLFNASFHLSSGSPCIDAGTATEAPALDFEGQTRPAGAAVDVGPDEFHP